MNRSGIGHVQQQAARTVMPGMTRQSTTASALGSRGAQFRAAEMQRGAPTKRADDDKRKDEDDDGLPDRAEGDNTDDEDEDTDEDKKKVQTDTAEDDRENDEKDDEKPDDKKNKKAKS